MGTAPRPWQRTLSNLSVTSKVGIVLLLPVILASVFAVLRIKDELGTIAQLNAAAQQAQIIRPVLDYGSAADDLAVAAGTGGTGDRALDQVSARFDQAAANLQSALELSQVDQQVSTEVTDALSAGRSLRNSLHGSSPLVIGNQSDEVATHISNALSTLTTPQETVLERYYTQLGDLTIARRMFLQQQLLIGSGEISNNPAMLAQALTATGAELTMINQYAVVQPISAYKPDVLLGAQQARLHALSQNNAEPMSLPGVGDSLKLSTATYTDATGHLVQLINSGLSQTSIAARSTVLRDVASVVVTLLAGLALALAVARSLVVPVRRLRRGALQVAHIDLPAELAVVREGGATPEILPVDVQTTEEIGQLARAVDDMHRQALHLAADQARLRLLISSMFETLSRRSQSLVEQQLTLIEDLERDEDNPGRLQSLFRLDHLATRMRRNGDNLLVLAGTALRRGHLPPVPLSDMLWSAVSQVEDYQRVEIGAVPDGIVAGEPAVDVEHLLAELIDNSLRYSPPSTPVAVSVNPASEGGYLIEITDRGLGMSGEDLRSINDRLASGGEVTVETARRMGLFVVGRLAKRHTVTVSLRRTSTMAQQPGITAAVHLPASLVTSGPQSESAGPQGAPFPAAAPGRSLSVAADPDAPEPGSLFATPGAGLPLRRPGRSSVSAAPPIPEPALGAPEPVRDGVIGFRPFDEAREDDDESAETSWGDTESETEHWAQVDEPTARSLARPATTSWRIPESDPSIDSWPTSQLSQPIRRRDPAEPEAPQESRPAESVPVQADIPEHTMSWSTDAADLWAQTATLPVQQPAPRETVTESPIYQRMVSEWLVEPSASEPVEAWSSPADDGWAAAAEASRPTTVHRTTGGLPIRAPGAQLVPGSLPPAAESAAPDPEEIRNNLSRHLSGVRSGRANTSYTDENGYNGTRSGGAAQYQDAQYTDGGHV
ncbi:signal transduction histidine kinase [Nocardia sp. GAS34]|uniref:sensor histidine kinase n=1 Tax=unclassified Nocardia TaxID=2637762 RepID=UPI003D19A27A